MESGEGLRAEVALCGKWFDREMRHTTAKAKKETGGLAKGPDWLAEQQRIVNQLILHQVHCRPIGYSVLTISRSGWTCAWLTANMGLVRRRNGAPVL